MPIPSALPGAESTLSTEPMMMMRDRVMAQFRDPSAMLMLLQAFQDGVLIVDRHGRVVLANPMMRSRFLLNDQQLGHPLTTVLGTTDLDDVLSQVLHHGEAQTTSWQLLRGGQTHDFRVSLVPLFDTQSETQAIEADNTLLNVKNTTVSGCVLMFHDETAIRRTERMRRDFVANVSHELRTPLSAIKGYAETLLEGALEDKAVSWDFVKVIFRHAIRLSDLVSDLLDLSKMEAEGFTPEFLAVHLPTLIEKVRAMTSDRAAAKAIQLQCTIEGPLPAVQGAPGSLEQVFTNLVDNAIKYTPEGGAVAVVARQLSDGMVEVRVKDTGMGIEAKHIPRLFERFYRVDKARSRDLGGTGLGLSIVKHIVQLHGGDIWVESTPNKGATFIFTLPPFHESASESLPA